MLPQDWNSLGRSSLVLSNCLNGQSSNPVWSEFYKTLEVRYPKVRNLDKLGAGPYLGFSVYEGPESIESVKRAVYILSIAGLLAELSEDGSSTILTIPAGWSIDELDALSKAAVVAGIPSAEIYYALHDDLIKETLRNSSIQKTQTFVVSNTVMRDSRDKTTKRQKELLIANGLEDEFPDALMVLTAAVVTRILTTGRASLYIRPAEKRYSNTRTKQMIPQGGRLLIESAPSCVIVSWSTVYCHDNVGVGGLRKV